MAYLLRHFRSSDHSSIQMIADEALGKGYFNISPEDAVIVAQDNSRIAGFICGSIREDGIALLRTICVARANRGRDLGYALGQAFIKQIARDRPVCSPAWIRREGGIPAAHLLQRLGLEPTDIITNYWQADSLRRGYNCPDCGAPPCRCSAKLFRSKGSSSINSTLCKS